MKILKELTKDKKIQLLRKETHRLSDELAVQKTENKKLQERIEELTNPYNNQSMSQIQQYEQSLLSEIDRVKELKEQYAALVEKQKRFNERERNKYKKATNKAISEFRKSLS